MGPNKTVLSVLLNTAENNIFFLNKNEVIM